MKQGNYLLFRWVWFKYGIFCFAFHSLLKLLAYLCIFSWISWMNMNWTFNVAGCVCGRTRVVLANLVYSQEGPSFCGDVLPLGTYGHPRELLLSLRRNHQPWKVTINNFFLKNFHTFAWLGFSLGNPKHMQCFGWNFYGRRTLLCLVGKEQRKKRYQFKCWRCKG